MPFGILSALEIFHKRIQQLFDDIANVEADIDDFLIWGTDEKSHDQTLIPNLNPMSGRNEGEQRHSQVRKVYISRYRVNVPGSCD